MTSAAEQVKKWLREASMTQAELAQAAAMDETALSKCLNGKRHFTADEFSRIDALFQEKRRTGFEEEQAAFVRAAEARFPVYRSRVAPTGDWIIERPAGPIRYESPPARAQGVIDLYGFQAPDEAAWPRYKMKEIVWVSPAEPAGPGDDALIVAKARGQGAMRGVIGEIISKSATAIAFRDFGSREIRQANAASVAVFCLVPREK